MSKKTTKQIFRDLDATLLTARKGLEDVLAPNPKHRLSGFRNLVVFGRAVTNALQNLRSTEPDFDKWYDPLVEEMRNDPLLRYFYKLRTRILKQGRLRTSVSAYISSFSTSDLHQFGPLPPNAKGFFIGDQNGGSGWEVELPDGSTEKYYVDLPVDTASVSVHLPEAPLEHLGERVDDNSVDKLGKLYYDYLDRLVNEAKIRFCNEEST